MPRKKKEDIEKTDDTKKKDDTKKSVDDYVRAEESSVDFSKEKIGHYSPAHLLYKLRCIRDNSINVVFTCAMTNKWKGLGAAEQAFEMAMNNIDRIEAKERTTGQGAGITINIPGFDPSQLKFGPPSPINDDAEEAETRH